ncbi:MAG: ATP synthase F1 subunit delta [Candidatus Omnitrophota bacterium]
MKDLVAAERYARALFELAAGQHQDHEFEAALVSLSAALDGAPEAQKRLLNPSVLPSQKREMLERIFHRREDIVEQVLLKFFCILLEKNRFDLVHEIARIFKKIADAAQKEGVLEIRSACELDPKAEQAILRRAEGLAGYTLRVEKQIDPEIVGGVILKIDHKIYDGSVLGKIRDLARQLTAVRTV